LGGKSEKGGMNKEKSRQPQKKACRIDQQPNFFSAYRFRWDNVPGDDTGKLKNFLKDEFTIDWAEDAEITNSDDDMTIYISTDKHSAEIIMDDNKKKATLKIRYGETHNLKVKKEGGKLNIYSYSSSIWRRVVKKLRAVLTLNEFINRIRKEHPILSFVIILLLSAVVSVVVADLYHDLIDQNEEKSAKIKHTAMIDNLTTEDNGYIHIWEPCTNSNAPEKGWLGVENPFYMLNINLDHSYYMIFDKERDKEILVYDDTDKSGFNLLTGCDLGFADHGGDNPIQYATTAIHDTNGIEYELVYKDRDRGFVLIDTEGWDTLQIDEGKLYDVEAEVMFGVFANKPYFINAVELSNLQGMGYVSQNPIKNPDEIVQSWVLIDEYRYMCCMEGEDNFTAKWRTPLSYDFTKIKGDDERKLWHVGSASFSKMFPEHILLGDKNIGGGVIFSLPEGEFRFVDSLDVYGDQIVGEFIINVEKPQKAITFTVNPVNEHLFFYDSFEFNASEDYKDWMKRICEIYNLTYPNGTLDAHNWQTKRYAYVITLIDQWYDKNANQVSNETWALADQGLRDFYSYQEIISKKMKETTPLSYQF
jgi:hypothetical protein